MKEIVKIRWGIIGLGKIAHKFAHDLQLVATAELVAVASRDFEKAKVFAAKFNSKKSYDNYDSILLDAHVDIIYIATPHHSHASITIKALKHKKHVLCEKPIALHFKDAEKMITTSRENKIFFMEALWTRFNPTFKEVFSRIQDGEIGEIKYINADFTFNAPDLEKVDDRKAALELGGGSLLDIGVYPLFLCYILLGIPDDILAKSNFHASGADLQTSMILQYKNAQAILHSSFISEPSIQAIIHGTKGQININTPWHQAQSYNFKTSISNKNIELPTFGMGFTYEIEECHRCIYEHKIESTLWSHQNSLDLMQIVERVKKEIGLEYPSNQNLN